MADESAPPIDLSELMRRMDDPSVPDAQIAPYLIPVPSPDGGIEPGFQPNPSRVTGLVTGLEGGLIVQSLNNRERRKRQRAYRDRIAAGWSGPRIVEEGDSWFQYPLLLEDIVDHMMRDHAVLSLSGAGHTLAQMLRQNEILAAISRERAAALMLSAGGNDLFENGNIARLIEDVRPGMSANDLVGARFDAFLSEVIGLYRGLLQRVHSAFPHVVMLIHGYSAAFSRMDRWVGRPLKEAGVMPVAVQNRVVEVMLARFNAAQKRLAAEPAFHGKLVHVDLTGLGREPGQWYDEIHMSSSQNRAAADLFADALRRHLPAAGGLEAGIAEVPEPAGAPVAAVAAHAAALSALDEHALLCELQERLDLIDRDPATADLPSAPLLSLSTGGLEGGIATTVGPLARRLLRRWERELYDLICGDAAADAAERTKLREALGAGQDALVGAIAAWLVSGPLGVSALLAGVLAALLVKRVGGSAVEEICTLWGERLNAAG
ncbi:SGNH/GDSL hydrolase family protein [Roseivivax isoporae]|uniref:SGNH hydrolase-type esterase domain-containing protein n=1 Tax=Roseivivax isoporae LMG 25204 TaxID=1449351 RepID=X7F2W7_9RHOB|nr:SGNH/GDSL hydrolase family protein [Roseivivax isoporae]ETX27267.1 hypothetical protein RISW2_14805 [Roseivivax isoporae LMG 25204]